VKGGWIRTNAPGGHVLFTLAGRPELGAIHVRARLEGRPRLADLLAAYPPERTPPRMLTTVEGELGVIVEAVDGERLRIVAMAYADDRFTVIEGVLASMEHHHLFRSTVETLAREQRFGLERDRRRRFLYQPPGGWAGVAREHETLWISPACPGHLELIRVFDATPLGQRRTVSPPGLAPEAVIPAGAFVTRDGMRGEVTTSSQMIPGQGRAIVSVATLRDDCFLYRFRLECDEASFGEVSELFTTVVLSTKPLTPRPQPVDLFAVWQD
jgi:hypothetical protein